MAEETTPTYVNRQLLTLRIRYNARAAVTSISFDPDRTTIREVIDVACPKFGITKPEMYGLAYSGNLNPANGTKANSSSSATSPRSPPGHHAILTKKKSFRDTTEWIPEGKTLVEAGLVSQAEVDLKIRHQISSGPHALRIMIPSERKDVVVKYTYTTTVLDLTTAVLQKLVHDKMTFKRNAVDRWKMFLPIVSTTEGIWLQETRTIDSYDLYSGYPTNTDPTMNIPADHLRPVILCRRIEDRDPVILGPYYKNQKEMRWLQRLDEVETMKKKDEKKLSELVRHGLPQTLRGAIWTRIAGTVSNPQTRPLQYLRYLHENLPSSVVKQIELDVPRTFPSHPFFHEGAQGRQSLYNVLHALAVKYPSVRYCQGQNYLAGICLLNMDEEDSFWLVDWIMQRWNWQGFFNTGMSLTSSPGHQLTMLAPIYVPEVHRHLSKLGIPYSIFCSTWFATLFAYDAPLPFVLRLWDIFLLEGPSILFRIALCILKGEQELLCTLDWDKILVFLREIPQRLYDVDSVIHAALKIKKHRIMERIFTPEEIREISSNGGNVPRSMQHSVSSESLNVTTVRESKTIPEPVEEERPSLLRQISQGLIPKKPPMTSAPSSPNLMVPTNRAETSQDSSSVDSSTTDESKLRPRSRSRSVEEKAGKLPSVEAPIGSLSSDSTGITDSQERVGSFSPEPYMFGTPYFLKPRKNPEPLQIIDSDVNGLAVFSLASKPDASTSSPSRPLVSAISMPSFDLAALAKARANVSTNSTRTTVAESQGSDAVASLPRSSSSDSSVQSSASQSSSRISGQKIPSLTLQPIAEDGSFSAPRNVKSAPNSPRKTPNMNREEVSSAIADMLRITPDVSEKGDTGDKPKTGYSDYLSAALSLENIRTSIPVPFEEKAASPAPDTSEASN